MKKAIIILFVLLITLAAGFWFFVLPKVPSDFLSHPGITKLDPKDGNFSVYQNNNYLKTLKNRDEAIEFAKQYTQTHVENEENGKWIWDNYPQFSVYHDNQEYYFSSMFDSLQFSKDKMGSYIINRANKARIWAQSDLLPTAHNIENVPLIAQNPELPRGCEVTSLAMLLNYYGIGVSKMDLAAEIKKNDAKYSVDKNGSITYGDPSNGFVGDMYDKSKPGLGVYHGPIFELLRDYIGADALDLTGANFPDLYYFISKDKPVWVITNYTFKPIGNDKFTQWNTESGPILITTYEHSVLVKGYDDEYIYINNPFDSTGSHAVNKNDFIEAWNQMGRQAVTYFD